MECESDTVSRDTVNVIVLTEIVALSDGVPSTVWDGHDGESVPDGDDDDRVANDSVMDSEGVNDRDGDVTSTVADGVRRDKVAVRVAGDEDTVEVQNGLKVDGLKVEADLMVSV